MMEMLKMEMDAVLLVPLKMAILALEEQFILLTLARKFVGMALIMEYGLAMTEMS